jgi:trimethylamine:corrinoid methyltransferase-like protein
LPQIVIDAEIAAMIRRLLGETEISPETMMADAIARVGFKGDYLKEKETARRLRRGEQFMPVIATRLSLEAWQAGGKDELIVASERVREIVVAADERGPVLPPDTMARLDSIVDEAVAATRQARGRG